MPIKNFEWGTYRKIHWELICNSEDPDTSIKPDTSDTKKKTKMPQFAFKAMICSASKILTHLGCSTKLWKVLCPCIQTKKKK